MLGSDKWEATGDTKKVSFFLRGKEKRPIVFVLGLGSAGVPQSSARDVLTTALLIFCNLLTAWPRPIPLIGSFHLFYDNNVCNS